MRNALISLFLFLSIALAAPDFLADFIPPLLGSSPAQDNDTIAEGSLELVKRQNGCATGYAACVNLNAPGLCCRTNEVCSADANQNVACCGLNIQCTGTIAPVAPRPTNLPVSSNFPATTTSNPFATVTTGPQPSFVQTGTGTQVRSTVPNEFYPFAFIATTYANAAACSSAYTTCQTDAASCTAALANGRQGVTVSAPNGGAVVTAVPSVGLESASSICQSLSSIACYQLDVRACEAYGNGGGTGAGRRQCADLYGLGAGVAVGIAGQLLR